ncbi:16S rRNA methyltransferase [Microbacterium sp. Root61]|uniref:16S rRNA (uracil(1498)-N(3))-methyltransferase n=1 Tax=Microbacterium sp. Root61 TaxID=1736570 RepID=UPI0006FE2F98|nr:16S rRNA (uracil(1498)-N(3))-methyltransferase [Microbacterium sp. Root61]KRA23331.1 16S rRNA methyltransferase [Microbacterium sp. Root61]
MALHFLLDEPTSAHAGDAVMLTGAEAHHAAAVRRVRVGEEVSVGDGRGAWLSGVCETVSPREVVVRITARTDAAAPRPRLVLVQALAKGDRDELAVQAATELGIDEIVPWQAARSVSRWDATKAVKGRARWATIVREAGKQAHRPWIPEVTDLSSTAQLAARAVTARVLLLEPTAPQALTAWSADATDDRDILLVVGPEGGIASEELDALTRAGATQVRLGHEVLRTSTAGPAAIALLSAALGRW